MNKDKVRMWVDALRSGEYRQTTGGLSRDIGENRAYCCLGVACEVAIKDGVVLAFEEKPFPLYHSYGDDDIGSFLPRAVQEWLGHDDGNVLVDGAARDGSAENATNLNDEAGWDFDRIADALEATFLKEDKEK